MSNINEPVLTSQEKLWSNLEDRESSEKLFEKLSLVTKQRNIGALAALTIEPTKWLKTSEIANFVDLGKSAISQGCNELHDVGLAEKEIVPGTENKRNPTLIFRLLPNTSVEVIKQYLIRNGAYKKYVSSQLYESVVQRLNLDSKDIKKIETNKNASLVDNYSLDLINNTMSNSSEKQLSSSESNIFEELQSLFDTSKECKAAKESYLKSQKDLEIKLNHLSELYGEKFEQLYSSMYFIDDIQKK